MKIKYPDDKEKERTSEVIKLFNIKSWEELLKLYLRSDDILLTCVFEKLTELSFNEFDMIFLFSVSLPSYTWQCGLKYPDSKMQTLQQRYD